MHVLEEALLVHLNFLLLRFGDAAEHRRVCLSLSQGLLCLSGRGSEKRNLLSVPDERRSRASSRESILENAYPSTSLSPLLSRGSIRRSSLSVNLRSRWIDGRSSWR